MPFLLGADAPVMRGSSLFFVSVSRFLVMVQCFLLPVDYQGVVELAPTQIWQMPLSMKIDNRRLCQTRIPLDKGASTSPSDELCKLKHLLLPAKLNLKIDNCPQGAEALARVYSVK